uniref:Conjugal transfer nickase/helicase TraI n=1 Tax=Escherichia coli TaxID=562 RepID=A0A2Z5VKA2_ECOLX|nr:conjugal transfer nickase/helicase TraI [Escherichia coli]
MISPIADRTQRLENREYHWRRLSTWENNPDALALVDSVYHRIAGISKDDGLISEPAHTG